MEMTKTYKERRKLKNYSLMKDGEFEKQFNLSQQQKRYNRTKNRNKPTIPNIDTKKARYLMIWYIKSQNTMVYVWRNALGSVIRAQGYRYTDTG